MELFDPTFLQSQLTWTGLAFAMLLVLMWKFVVPAVNGILDARISKIQNDLDDAEKAREDSEKALADYTRQLQKARSEASEIVNRAREDSQKLIEARTAELEADLKRKAEDARKNIDAARESALNDIKKEVAGMVVMVAEKVIDAEVDAKKAGKITDESIKELMN